jgi:hypothetical protein
LSLPKLLPDMFATAPKPNRRGGAAARRRRERSATGHCGRVLLQGAQANLQGAQANLLGALANLASRSQFRRNAPDDAFEILKRGELNYDLALALAELYFDACLEHVG